jgi:hypothetical protein
MQLPLMQIALLLFPFVAFCCGVLERVPREDLILKTFGSAARLHSNRSATVRGEGKVFVAYGSGVMIEAGSAQVGKLSGRGKAGLLFGRGHGVKCKLVGVLRGVKEEARYD